VHPSLPAISHHASFHGTPPTSTVLQRGESKRCCNLAIFGPAHTLRYDSAAGAVKGWDHGKSDRHDVVTSASAALTL